MSKPKSENKLFSDFVVIIKNGKICDFITCAYKWNPGIKININDQKEKTENVKIACVLILVFLFQNKNPLAVGYTDQKSATLLTISQSR